MAEERKRGGRSGINWLAVRTAYVVKQWSAKKCAAEFGINETTVKVRAAKEGWTEERTRNATHATEVATAEATAVVQEASAALRQSHEEFVSWMLGLIRESESDLKQIESPRGRIEARAKVVEMVDRGIRISRLQRGLRDGVPSDDADAIAGIPEISLVPPPPQTFEHEPEHDESTG